MKKKTIALLFLMAAWPLMFFGTAKAEAPIEQHSYGKDAIQSMIGYYASEYGVSAKVMDRVVSCESNYDPDTVGDNGKSFGLVQIHMGYWGDKVTVEQAKDPAYALEFLARKLSRNEGHLWTCYRMYY